jgi:cytochrome P450
MSAQGGEKRNDILQILLDSQVAVHSEDRLTADAIISETLVFLVAGSETTSNTLGFAIYSLLSHPEQLQKLYKEIDEVPSEGGPFKHEQLKNLPYLNAVINETLRVFSVLPSGLQRMTVKKTILGERYVLPEGVRNYY